MKNSEEKVEEFLAKLPKDTVAKIKKLKFANNLVLINRRYNLLQNVEVQIMEADIVMAQIYAKITQRLIKEENV